MEKEFNEQDSLRLINEMIAQAKGNFKKGAGNSLILWGYAIALISMLCYVLPLVLPNNVKIYWLWALTIPLFIINWFYLKNKAKEALVTTQIEKAVGTVWLAMAVTSVLFVAFIFFISLSIPTKIPYLFITPMMMVFSGSGLLVTSKIYRFKPFLYGAFVFWGGAIICILHYIYFKGPDLEFIILSLSMVFGFIIPGHILNKKAEKDV